MSIRQIRQLSFDPLEARLAMDISASVVAEQLRVGGTAGDEEISVVLNLHDNEIPQSSGQWFDFAVSKHVPKLGGWIQVANMENVFLSSIQIHGFGGNDERWYQIDQLSQYPESIFYGDAGNDTIHGMQGKDTIYGGPGTDSLEGGDGRDELYGESGSDILYGGYGRDVIFGGGEREFLYGEGDEDSLHGGAGNDDLDGGNDRDFLYGQLGNDRLEGGFDSVRDTLWGDDPFNNIRGADRYIVYRHRYNGQWIIDESERNMEMDDRDSIVYEGI